MMNARTKEKDPANNPITMGEDQLYTSDVLPKFMANRKVVIAAETIMQPPASTREKKVLKFDLDNLCSGFVGISKYK
jgi:hypothetical protein